MRIAWAGRLWQNWSKMSTFSGTYELADAGRFISATAPGRPPHYRTIHRWVRSGLPNSDSTRVKAKEPFISFEDLISLRMIVALRQAEFSLKDVREVQRWLREATGYSRPFALKDLWLSDSEIFIDMEGFLLSATQRGQYAMDFVRGWLRQLQRPSVGTLDIMFEPFNGTARASAWTPHTNVVLNPKVQFGAPCIEGTRIPTKAVLSMIQGGDAPATLAKDYGVSLDRIESALAWEKRLAGFSPE